MDLLTKTSIFIAQIEKLGDIKLLVEATKAQEQAAKTSEEARELYNKYLETKQEKDK